MQVRCETRQGIRISKDEHFVNCTPKSQQVQETKIKLLMAVYSAWWFFCKRILGLDVSELLRADYTPVNFSVAIETDPIPKENPWSKIDRYSQSEWEQTNWEYGLDPRSHRSMAGVIWYELIWSGKLNIQISIEDQTVQPAVVAFIKAVNDSWVRLGGGNSIGHGFVTIESIPRPEFIKNGRCKKGHFTDKKTGSFGGVCKCGAKIVPAWTIPPQNLFEGGEI